MSYYKEHSEEFIENTFFCDMSIQYQMFEKYLTHKGKLLDIGFGSGRDSLYFKNKGYEIYSIDPEEEFIKHATSLGLEKTFQIRAEDINFKDTFDGIWACASLLHIPSSSLKEVFKRCSTALKKNGIMYVSFKYGNFEGIRHQKYYTDLDMKSLSYIIDNTEFILLETSITKDVRPNKNEKWLNAILRKK